MDALIKPLIEDLRNKDEGVRNKAIRNLTSVFSERKNLPEYAVLELISTLLKDEDKSVREWTASLLNQVLDTSKAVSVIIIRAFITALTDEHWIVRSAAVEALGRQKTPSNQTIKALTTALEDKNSLVKKKVVEVLRQYETLPDNTILALIEKLRGKYAEFESIVSKTLIQYKKLPDKAIDMLIVLAGDKREAAREAAARVLANQKSPSLAVTQTLESALQDKSKKVRDAATNPASLNFYLQCQHNRNFKVLRSRLRINARLLSRPKLTRSLFS